MRFSGVSLFFAVDGSLLDEEYHHTQLLQMKVQHPQVAVDVLGDVRDETVLLQTGVGKMLKKARAQAVKAQFMNSLLRKKQAKVKQVRGGPRGPAVGGPPSGGEEKCFLREDNLWAPEDIPPYIGCLKSRCQDFDPSRIFDGMSCGDIIGMGFKCTEEIPGAHHIPPGTTLSDMCSVTCSACEAPALADSQAQAQQRVGPGPPGGLPAVRTTTGCPPPGGPPAGGEEKCFLREDNLWAPEDIPPYIDCLKSRCQDFDPSRIFDGMSCGDIIGMGFKCTEEIPGAHHIPPGTTLSDMCSGTCSADGLPAGNGPPGGLPAGNGTHNGLPAGGGTQNGLPAGGGTHNGLPAVRTTTGGPQEGQDYSKCTQVGNCFKDSTSEHSDFVGMVCGMDRSSNPATCQMVNGDFLCMHCGGEGPSPGGRPQDEGDSGKEACKHFFGEERIDECMGCGHSCMQNHPCDGEECMHSEPFMVCQGECMGSPLGGKQASEGMQGCMEFYPGQEGECMECGGHCIESFPCHDRDSCMNNTGFMDCHSNCMLDPEMGGEDEGERACKDFYPGEFDQCMDCGGRCVEQHACEGPQDCFENEGFMHCHGDCMMQTYDPSNDPEVKENCKMLYGEDVNVPQCFECGWGCTMDVPDEAWADPDTFKSVMECADKCMGKDNLVYSSCVEGYGKEVDVMQCISCGQMCGCGPEGCDEECHANCMGSGHEEYNDEGKEECKEFYGKDVDVDLCLSCAEGCYEQAGDFAQEPSEWFNAFINCQDNCVGSENRATGMCKKLGGEAADLTRCFTCGMGCCQNLDECEKQGGQSSQCMSECYHSDEKPSTYGSVGPRIGANLTYGPMTGANYTTWDSNLTYGPMTGANYTTWDSNYSSWDSNYSSWDSNYSSWDSNYSSWDSNYSSWDSNYSSWDSNYSSWGSNNVSTYAPTFGSWDSTMGFDSFTNGSHGKPGKLFGRRVRQEVADGTDLMQVKKHLKRQQHHVINIEK